MICDVGPGDGLQNEEILGRELPGQVYRAGTFAPVAG